MSSTMRILTGGRVFTADPEQPWAEAVVIDGERIAFVGGRQAAREHAGEGASLTDTGGGVVVPGFVDAHAHVVMTGAGMLKAQLRDAPDLPEIQRRLVEWSRANPTEPRVLGISWQFSSVPGGAPTVAMIDAVIDDRPVYLEANDLHSAWVNSRALEELGITGDTPDPIGGQIVRDAAGAATGHLLETALVELVWPVVGRVGDAERDRHLAAAIRAYTECGVTTAVDMAMTEDSLAAMIRAEQRGALDVRIVGHWIVRRCADPADEVAQVAHAATLAATYGSDRLRIAGIKIIVDGTIDGCTAAMIEPYSNGSNADPIWDYDSLVRVVTAADAAGLQVAMHAIGDRAVRSAIDALEQAIATNGSSGRRHRIEHLEYVDEADVARLAQLGITASMQPVHIDPAILPNWAAMLGDHRVDRGFAWPEFLAAGATLAFGTDTPTAPHLPLHNMYIAATRKSPGDSTIEPHRPDFALPLAESVVHATRDAAWASFLDDRVGTIRAGNIADLVVLDCDPFALGPDSLLTARAVETIVGGGTVHLAR
ncbi:MAG: amidohydrolase [Ilumatobacteraceae bacterium]